jgi:hypothetical protein
MGNVKQRYIVPLFPRFPVRHHLNFFLAAALCLSFPAHLFCQAPPSSNATIEKSTTVAAPSTSDIKPDLPKFEVATVKPAVDTDMSMLRFTPDGISINNIPLKMLIRESFGI